VPKHQLQFCTQDAYAKKWGQQYATNYTGVMLNWESKSNQQLAAVMVHTNYPDVLAEVRLRVPENCYQFVSKDYHVFLFKSLLADPSIKSPISPSSYYLEEYSPIPVVKVLTDVCPLYLPENFIIPTQEQLDNLPVLNSQVQLDFERFYNLDKLPLTKHSKEDLVFDVNKNIGQFDVAMTRYATIFSYEVLRNSKPILPLIYELEALHTSESEGLVLTPQFSKEVYINKLFSFLLEEIHNHNLRLPPNWDKGFGRNLKLKYNSPITKNLVQLEFEKLKEVIFTKLCDSFQNESLMLKTVHEIIQLIGQHTLITRIELDNLKRFVSRQSGLQIHMNKLDSQITEARRHSLGVDTLESVVNCLVNLLTKETQHRYSDKHLWAWNGCYWEVVPDFTIVELYNRFFDQSTTKAYNKKLVLHGVKVQLLAELKRRDIEGVNFLNGFVTEQSQVLPHDPDMGLTYVLPFNYQPTQEIPTLFEDFLTECWGRTEDFKDKVYTLRQAMAVTFFNKAPSYQRAFLLHGAPQSGKTQLLNIIKELTPKHKRGAISPENWTNINSLLSLRTKMLNVCGELSESKDINSQIFKDVVDGGELDDNLKAKHRTSITAHGASLTNPEQTAMSVHKVTCAHWFASNHLPKTKDFSYGFSRRWLIFDFPNPVPSHKRIPDIATRIVRQEKEAILCWVISGFSTIANKSDYHLSESFKQKTEELGQKNNHVKWFLEASGLFVFDPHFAEQIDPLTLEEKNTLLNGLAYFESRKLYIRFKQVTNSTLNQTEFQHQMREFAATKGFLSVVCQAQDGGIETRYYGFREK
jgi:hypothetical protein